MSFRSLVTYFSFAIFPFLAFSSAKAQENKSAFDFLNLPTSSHAMALGGKNISLMEDDASLVFQNPALMSSVSDKTLSFNFLTYMQGSKAGSFNYVQAHKDRGTWGAMAQFVGYGDIIGLNQEGIYEGNLSGLDLNLGVGYSYLLSDRWVGGVTGKFIYSNYAGYSSIALAVDLGVNYYNPDNDFSFSAVAANLGGQVSAFGEIGESLPIDLQLGVSKGLKHLPLRLHLMFYDMFHWGKYYYAPDKELGGFQIFMNHLNLGADLSLYQDRLWIALGYNFRRAQEMKAGGSSHAAGLTLGAGINIKKIKCGVAYGKYHAGAPTLSFTVAYSFAKEAKAIKNNTNNINNDIPLTE